MFPGQQHQESDEGGMDFHFNGFALRSNDGNTNDETEYMFMAFAEGTFEFSNSAGKLEVSPAKLWIATENIWFSHVLKKSGCSMRKHMKMHMFVWNLVRIGSGIFRNVFTTFVLLWNHPAGFFLHQKQRFPKFWTWSFFKK